MGELRIMGRKGDTKVSWDPGNQVEVGEAEKSFVAYRAKGFAAFRTTKGGNKGKQITVFDPNAEEILFVPPIAGG